MIKYVPLVTSTADFRDINESYIYYEKVNLHGVYREYIIDKYNVLEEAIFNNGLRNNISQRFFSKNRNNIKSYKYGLENGVQLQFYYRG